MTLDAAVAIAQLPQPRGRRARVLTLAGAVLALASCATIGPPSQPAPEPTRTAPPLPRNAEPPAPKVNLSGFPLAYRQGYADGCASASGPERKDGERFAKDANYSTGWQDGIALCRKR